MEKRNITIRAYHHEDASEIVELFSGTVHTINKHDYNQSQLNAWAPQQIECYKWCESLAVDFTLVAVFEDQIVGFGNVNKECELDRLYVHKDFQGWGIGSMIMNELEVYARQQGLSKLSTYASITACPFFVRRGYQVIRENKVIRQGQELTNYLMDKAL